MSLGATQKFGGTQVFLSFSYLHAIEIPCPHHRLSKGATAGITAGCILAGQLIDVLIRMLIATPLYSVVVPGILLQREDHGVYQAEERSEGARGFCDGATEQGGFLGVSGMVLDVVFVRDTLFFPSMNPHQYLVHEKSSVSARCRRGYGGGGGVLGLDQRQPMPRGKHDRRSENTFDELFFAAPHGEVNTAPAMHVYVQNVL